MSLALDSSTSLLSLALGVPGPEGIRWSSTNDLPDGGRHGIALPLAIDRMLVEAGASLADLSALAVGLGPGSFTGLRVGVATLKGLAFARKLPLAGASSLRALARAALQSGVPAPVVAVMDAKHGELYAGVFEGPDARPLMPELALEPAGLAAALGVHRETATLVGEGVAAYRAVLEKDFRLAQLASNTPAHPQAIHVAALCLPAAPFSLEALFRIEPSYVRASTPEIRFPQGTFTPREGL